MLCDVPYFAFEHGTIREIPYNNDATGRLTALAYRKAEHVFVTNFDCVDSANYLAPGKYTVINHPFDEDHGMAIVDAVQQRQRILEELDADFIFFHPTRQDWVPGTGYADKANDIFIHAFGKLRALGYRVGLVLCKWGKNIEETVDLINDYQCSGHVKWVSPLAIIEFERMCKASDIVVDQFKYGSFGGVLFKAMSVGAPILTYLNESQIKNQYSKVPPVINCITTDEIVSEIKKALVDKNTLIDLGRQGRNWIEMYHSKNQTINAQIDQFRLRSPFTLSDNHMTLR
jgi:glycosyltransferase involved in cell wall biosynthesis